MSKRVERIKIGRKKYSLNDIWKLCRKMWEDIKDAHDIPNAKVAWTRKHRYRDAVDCHCFFCEWASQQWVASANYYRTNKCLWCPGRKVSPVFDCCNSSYHYKDRPRKFEAKVRALDTKRKAK